MEDLKQVDTSGIWMPMQKVFEFDRIFDPRPMGYSECASKAYYDICGDDSAARANKIISDMMDHDRKVAESERRLKAYNKNKEKLKRNHASG